LGRHQKIELVFGQMVFQIAHHIKVFPPAVQNFKAWLLVVTTDLAIMTWYGVAQARATPYQYLGVIFHAGFILHCQNNFELFAKYDSGWKAWRRKNN
jgi:uncharacterized membrane protein